MHPLIACTHWGPSSMYVPGTWLVLHSWKSTVTGTRADLPDSKAPSMPTNSFHIILLVMLQIIQEWESHNSGLQGDHSVVETNPHWDVSNPVAGGKWESFLRSSVWGVISLFKLVWCPSKVHKLKSKILNMTYKDPPWSGPFLLFSAHLGHFPVSMPPKITHAMLLWLHWPALCLLPHAPPCLVVLPRQCLLHGMLSLFSSLPPTSNFTSTNSVHSSGLR